MGAHCQCMPVFSGQRMKVLLIAWSPLSCANPFLCHASILFFSFLFYSFPPTGKGKGRGDGERQGNGKCTTNAHFFFLVIAFCFFVANRHHAILQNPLDQKEREKKKASPTGNGSKGLWTQHHRLGATVQFFFSLLDTRTWTLRAGFVFGHEKLKYAHYNRVPGSFLCPNNKKKKRPPFKTAEILSPSFGSFRGHAHTAIINYRYG